MFWTIVYRLFIHYRFHLVAIAFTFAVSTYFHATPPRSFINSALSGFLFAVINRAREEYRQILLERANQSLTAATNPSQRIKEPVHRPKLRIRWRAAFATVRVAFVWLGLIILLIAGVAYLYFYLRLRSDLSG